jgi:aspartate ammonia-lyase
MPGKINPVIPEAVSQAAMNVMGRDHTLTLACSSGNLELNAFLPLIADSLLHGIDELTHAVRMLHEECVVGIEANADRCRDHVSAATAVITALVGQIGYATAQRILEHARTNGQSIREAAIASGRMSATEFDELVAPEAVTRLGFPPERQ